MKKQKMDKQVQVRMPIGVWEQLQGLAATRAPGTTPALLIRDAIHKTYCTPDAESVGGETEDQKQTRKARKPKRRPKKPSEEGKKNP